MNVKPDIEPSSGNVVRIEPRRDTPQTTIDALMYGLRGRGLACLDDPGNLDRLRRCDRPAIGQIAKRLSALRWGDDDVEKIIKAWRVLERGQS